MFTLALFGIWTTLVRERDPFHLALLVATGALLLLSLLLASSGVSIAICLVVVECAPIVTVIGFETVGHRHVTDVMRRTHASSPVRDTSA